MTIPRFLLRMRRRIGLMCCEGLRRCVRESGHRQRIALFGESDGVWILAGGELTPPHLSRAKLIDRQTADPPVRQLDFIDNHERGRRAFVEDAHHEVGHSRDQQPSSVLASRLRA